MNFKRKTKNLEPQAENKQKKKSQSALEYLLLVGGVIVVVIVVVTLLMDILGEAGDVELPPDYFCLMQQASNCNAIIEHKGLRYRCWPQNNVCRVRGLAGDVAGGPMGGP